MKSGIPDRAWSRQLKRPDGFQNVKPSQIFPTIDSYPGFIDSLGVIVFFDYRILFSVSVSLISRTSRTLARRDLNSHVSVRDKIIFCVRGPIFVTLFSKLV